MRGLNIKPLTQEKHTLETDFLLKYRYLRWLEIVSWRARPGPLITRARASTPGSRRCKFSDLVPSKILQNLYFGQKYL